MKKYEKFSKEEIQNIIDDSSTYKEVLIKLGYANSAKSTLLNEIANKYQLNVSNLTIGMKQKWQNFSEEEIKYIINTSTTYKEILKKLGYNGNTHENYVVNNLANKYNISLKHLRRTGDLSGQQFNFWTVLEKDKNPKDSQNSYWICQCKCGKISSLPYSNLVGNRSFSCGCQKYSKGELLIEQYLKELNYQYIPQYSPKDIQSYKGCPLYFDFYLSDLNIFIEFQGEQHYKTMGYLGGEERFERQIKNDEIKRNYCNERKIKLIEIPYTDLSKINSSYLQKRITK